MNTDGDREKGRRHEGQSCPDGIGMIAVETK